MKVPTQSLVGADRHARDAAQAVRPARRQLGRGAQLSPVLGELLDAGYLVRGVGLEQPLQPLAPGPGVGGRRGDDPGEGGDGVVHRRADGPR